MYLNAQERFINTMKFKKIDRPFRWETPAFCPSTIEKWGKEQGFPEWVTDDTNRGFIVSKTINDYSGMDPLEFIPVETGWDGSPFCPTFEPKVIEEDNNYITMLEKTE